MKTSAYLASAGALLAIMAFRQHTTHVAPKLRPTTVQHTKSLTGTQQTAVVTDVVMAANAFLATLTTAQQAAVLQTFSAANVSKWSNFPIAGYNGRIGIRLDALTAAQRTAAMAVVQAALVRLPTRASTRFSRFELPMITSFPWVAIVAFSAVTSTSLLSWARPVPLVSGCCSAAATTRPPT